MADVVSFRPSEEEKQAIDRTQATLGLATRAEAVRYLVRKGAERAGPLNKDPVFTIRIARRHRGKRTMSSRELDEFLYGKGR